jgi:hypothetical protein
MFAGPMRRRSIREDALVDDDLAAIDGLRAP